MFKNRRPEYGPLYIERRDRGNEFFYDTKKAEGLWYRVIPETAKEIFYVQFLHKGTSKLVPAEGDGILIRADALMP